MNHRFPWTKQAVSRFKALWLDHKSQDIADTLTSEFGTTFTRYAVVALARRLDLAHKKSGGVQEPTEKPAPVKPAQRYIKRSAEQKGLQPIWFTPAIIIEPTKEQLAADKKLIDEWIATKGVTVCEPATFIPLTHDFNRVARSSKGGM